MLSRNIEDYEDTIKNFKDCMRSYSNRYEDPLIIGKTEYDD